MSSGGGGGAPQRNLEAETRGELEAKLALQPDIFRAEQEFRPQYTALELQSLSNLLEGTQGGSREVPYTTNEAGWQNRWTGEFSTTEPNRPSSRLRGRSADRAQMDYMAWTPHTRETSGTRTVTDPVQPGLFDILGKTADKAAAVDAKGLSYQRRADIQDVMDLGPASLAAQRASDPQTAGLVDSMTLEAAEELQLGTQLDPAQRRLVQQSVRSGQAARGMGFGESDVYQEALATSEFGQQLRQNRRGYASGVAALRQGIYGEGFNRVLGRSGGANGLQTAQVGNVMGAGSGPRLFGSTVNANDVYDTNVNATSAERIAGKNAQGAMIGGGVAAAGGIAAAAIIAA